MYDVELMLRSGLDAEGLPLDLEASEQAEDWVDFGGPDRVPLTYDVVVPEIADALNTLDVIIQVSDDEDGAVVEDTFTLPQITGAAAVGVYRITFKTPHRYRQQYNTVAAGGGAAPNFGVVVIGPQLGGEYDQF